MKILSKSDQDDILNKLVHLQLLSNQHIRDMNALSDITNTLFNLIVMTNGCDGAKEAISMIKES